MSQKAKKETTTHPKVNKKEPIANLSRQISKCANQACGDTFESDDEAIECWRCKGWFHRKCASLTDHEFTQIVRLENAGVQWICKQCLIPAPRSVPPSDSEAGDLKVMMLNMSNTIDILLKKYPKWKRKDQMKREVEEDGL